MSFKAKDLQYEAAQPAFLRRLRQQNGGQELDGRHERPVARPQKARLENEDDAPTYVVEGSNDTVSKAEYEALMKTEDQSAEKDAGDGDTLGFKGKSVDDGPKASGALPDDIIMKADAGASKSDTTKSATIGSKKRKAAKVIGGDEGQEDDEDALSTGPKVKTNKKSGKKGKTVKLSFEDE